MSEIVYKFKVCARCFTFNQASYIEDTMNGFAMQLTTFPVITLIVDDASTDGEQNVIRDYLKEHFQKPYREEETEFASVICAKHKTNLNCEFIVFLLKYNHYSIKKDKSAYLVPWTDNSKYFADCEGDDYWVDPQKLQKQVDYLEAHPECSLVRTNLNRLHQTTQQVETSFFTSKLSGNIKDTYMDYIFNSWFCGTCTWCYRKIVYDEYKSLCRKLDNQCFKGDTLRTLAACRLGSIKYFNDITTVYRILDKSASHFNNNKDKYKFWGSVARTRTYFANEFDWKFKVRFYLKICKECVMNMLYARDMKHFGFFFSFSSREFGYLFIESKKLKLK